MRGQTFDVAVQVFNTGPEPMTLDAVALNVPGGWTATLAERRSPATLAYNQSATFVYTVTVGAERALLAAVLEGASGRRSLRPSRSPNITTLPWSPPDVTATVQVHGGRRVRDAATVDAYYRYDGPWVGGEKQKSREHRARAVSEADAGHRASCRSRPAASRASSA